ncbi:hypothetical protein MBLNU459_g4762t1 [Dothideomycetes sp. NU459]
MSRDEHVSDDDDEAEQERVRSSPPPALDEDIDQKYPNKPHNHSVALPFSSLYKDLFDPLDQHRKRPTGPPQARRKQGPHGSTQQTPQEARRSIIARYISRWRKEVGNDIYPVIRLIVPEKDRDRAMYGLKEKTIGKLLVKLMKIDKNSDDAFGLLNWKMPGVRTHSAMAGDFAGRCYEVLSKRQLRTEPSKLNIDQVNDMLDRLAGAQKDYDMLLVFEEFYRSMNAIEMMWLVRMILRQMKIGASEKTILDIWHPDAETLFNVSSSLRRVCWELFSPEVRLVGDTGQLTLMQCFQPQLAAFQMRSMEKIVDRMHLSDDDPVFWIEEKLDGERMQLHMEQDNDEPGGFKFGFWSRKAKDYTYLYGRSFKDEKSALTRHIKGAFDKGVRNIILDGEMITWIPSENRMRPFGTLKTAALSEKNNEFSNGDRPLYRVFDCLYLNDKSLTNYTLRDRRLALDRSVRDVHRRIEKHEFVEADTPKQIEAELQKIVASSSEGLVVKRPASIYQLNQRNEDWIKVKPDYMSESVWSSLDCIVVGGYYGSGHRGGTLSSFLCGLRLKDEQLLGGVHPQKCFSFFKVGGGFATADLAEIRHRTDGKWIDWNPRNPPSHIIELGGGERQCERPDVWIMPEDSVVFEVKAASIHPTKDFKVGQTLRFPRFKRLRTDKAWKDSLSISDFDLLQRSANEQREEKQFKLDDARKQKRAVQSRKKKLTVIGANDTVAAPYGGPHSKVFAGLTIYIITAAAKPLNKSKAELEQLVKANGGQITNSQRDPQTICIAEGNQVKVASIKKDNNRNLIRPLWLLDCVKQAESDVGHTSLLLPLEPRHILFSKSEDKGIFDRNIDFYKDSYTRDSTAEELWQILSAMPASKTGNYDEDETLHRLFVDDVSIGAPGWMCRGLNVHLFQSPAVAHDDSAMQIDKGELILEPILRNAGRLVQFTGGHLVQSLDEQKVTHVIVGKDYSALPALRHRLATFSKQPRIVTTDWITESWREKTRLDEERFTPI